MKSLIFYSKGSFYKLFILLPVFLFCSLYVFSNSLIKNSSSDIPVLKKGMYVIVGVFGVESNAHRYVNFVRKFNYSAGIARKQGTNLNYTYIFYTPDDLETARQKRTEARSIHELRDSWILYVDVPMPTGEKHGKFTPLPPPEEEVSQAAEPRAQEETQVEKPVSEPAFIAKTSKPGMYSYLFNVTNTTTLKEVNGYVTIVDAERNKQIRKVLTNTVQEIKAPNTKTKRIIAICDIFGYLKQQVELKIDDPLNGTDPNIVSKENDVTTVKFSLQWHKKGDIITMYNVYFYNDATIMKPGSKYELTCLLNMLKENPNYTIKLHGHTNGNSPGKIIKLKPDDENFFQVTSNNIEIFGSAKDLSLERANTIRRYLIAKGISADRMTIKGWGGKQMIYKKNDPLAKRNVRVEVEILSD